MWGHFIMWIFFSLLILYIKLWLSYFPYIMKIAPHPGQKRICIYNLSRSLRQITNNYTMMKSAWCLTLQTAQQRMTKLRKLH